LTPRKQRQVRLAVGEAVETLVARYATISWDLPALADFQRRALARDEIACLEIKFADVIDDHLDRGLDYSPAKKMAGEAADNATWVEAVARTARAIGRPQMAGELESLAARRGPVPDCLVHARAESFVVAPLSHRERIVSLVARKFSRRRHGGRLVA
jgi:hypothetical protein